MKLIGAGLPRTATLTQKVALEMLGLGPCYHMVDVLGDLERAQGWQQALDGEPDWPAIFDGYQSTVDWPGGFFYRELTEVYPEAKVLLSVRDGDSWERSMRETVWGVAHGDTLIRHLSSARAFVDPAWAAFIQMTKGLLWEGRGTFAGGHASREELIAGMDAHNDEVRHAVPAERLLEWRPADGWEPLCGFFDVEVPAAPVPHLNDSATFADRVFEGSIHALDEWWARRRPEVPATAR